MGVAGTVGAGVANTRATSALLAVANTREAAAGFARGCGPTGIRVAAAAGPADPPRRGDDESESLVHGPGTGDPDSLCVCVCVYVCVWRTDRKPRPGPAQLSRALARPARASGLERAARSPGPERAASPPGWSAGASLSATWAPAPASPRLVRLRNRPKVSTLDTVTATVVRHSQIIRFARPAAPLYLKGVRRIRANSGLSDPTLSVWKPNIITIYQSGNPTLSVWKPNIIGLETQHYRSGLSVWKPLVQTHTRSHPLHICPILGI